MKENKTYASRSWPHAQIESPGSHLLSMAGENVTPLSMARQPGHRAPHSCSDFVTTSPPSADSHCSLDSSPYLTHLIHIFVWLLEQWLIGPPASNKIPVSPFGRESLGCQLQTPGTDTGLVQSMPLHSTLDTLSAQGGGHGLGVSLVTFCPAQRQKYKNSFSWLKER